MRLLQNLPAFIRKYPFACRLLAAITNHDEYSLIRELSDDEKEKTLTLRRRGEKEVEKMKKKWKTDERESTELLSHQCLLNLVPDQCHCASPRLARIEVAALGSRRVSHSRRNLQSQVAPVH